MNFSHENNRDNFCAIFTFLVHDCIRFELILILFLIQSICKTPFYSLNNDNCTVTVIITSIRVHKNVLTSKHPFWDN